MYLSMCLSTLLDLGYVFEKKEEERKKGDERREMKNGQVSYGREEPTSLEKRDEQWTCV